MGGGKYKGGATRYHSISDNIKKTSSIYEYNNGYFGKKAKKKDNTIRHIESSNPIKTSKDFYNHIAYGGYEKEIPNGKRANLEDGTVITWREKSSSDGSPVVDINITKSKKSGGLKKQKIHFIKGE